MNLEQIKEIADRVRGEIGKIVIGQDEVVTLLLTSLLAQGHILLEGVPGTAKTLLARTFAATMSLDFNRVQFTPDLMPGDLLGTNLFNFQTNQFIFTAGPIFTQLLLADEINRTPPKTQSALLQAMQERLVTIDGETRSLGDGFMVIATQNPLEQEGTYPLPEAQLDRFLFKVVVDYPSRDQERTMIALHGHRSSMPEVAEMGVEAIANLEVIASLRALVSQIELNEAMIDYIVDLIRATREHPSLLAGASPRSGNMLATAARAYASLQGRPYVIPDDVKAVVLPTIAHRLVLSPGAEMEGLSATGVLSQIVQRVAAPR